MKYELNAEQTAYVVVNNANEEVARFDFETDAEKYCKEHGDGPHDMLGICQRISALDEERWMLNQRLIGLTGQNFEEVMAGMTRLLAPADVDPAIIDARAQRWLESGRGR